MLMSSFRTVLHDPETCPWARVLLPNAFLWLVPSSQDLHVTRNLLRKSSPKCTFRSHCIQKELHLVSKHSLDISRGSIFGPESEILIMNCAGGLERPLQQGYCGKVK